MHHSDDSPRRTLTAYVNLTYIKTVKKNLTLYGSWHTNQWNTQLPQSHICLLRRQAGGEGESCSWSFWTLGVSTVWYSVRLSWGDCVWWLISQRSCLLPPVTFTGAHAFLSQKTAEKCKLLKMTVFQLHKLRKMHRVKKIRCMRYYIKKAWIYPFINSYFICLLS